MSEARVQVTNFVDNPEVTKEENKQKAETWKQKFEVVPARDGGFYNNLFKVKTFKGILPEELKGWYTKVEEAQKAINVYCEDKFKV